MKTNDAMNAVKKDAEILSRNTRALSEEENAQITGGQNTDGRHDDYVTKMVCPCGYSKDWYGYFVGDVFDCPKCGQHTLKGERKV